MTTREARDEVDIRHLIERAVEAIRTRDLDGLRRCFTADVVSFDVGPRLQDVGVEAKLNSWREIFTVLHPPLDYEIRELRVIVGHDVAFAHAINRLTGTFDGSRFGSWVRWTAGLRKIGNDWSIAHDQVSFPFDPVSGRTVLDLEPGV